MKHTIRTRLVGREEVFKVLALAEALQIPVLLEGPPGTGKSHAMYDYSGNRDDIFLVELDAGSKASEVKGFINMKRLLEDKVYETFSPITSKARILINEVEKGSSEIRNTLLSIMQEKQLQLGSEGVKECQWKSFVGTCNSIPQDERKEPFWDRFLIKHSVSPLTIEEMKQARKMEFHDVEIDIPEPQDLPAISSSMLDKFDSLTVSALSDRARINVSRLASGIKYIWNLDDYQALCKVAAFLCPTMVAQISSSLIPQEIVEMKSMIKNIDSTVDFDAKSQMFAKLSQSYKTYIRKRDHDKEAIVSVKAEISRLLDHMEKILKEKTKEAIAEPTETVDASNTTSQTK